MSGKVILKCFLGCHNTRHNYSESTASILLTPYTPRSLSPDTLGSKNNTMAWVYGRVKSKSCSRYVEEGETHTPR